MDTGKIDGIIAVMRDQPDDKKLDVLFGPHLRTLYGCWPEDEQFEFFTRLIELFFLKQPFHFCQMLIRKWPDGIHYSEAIGYFSKQFRVYLEGYVGVGHNRIHATDVLSAVRWLYDSIRTSCGDLGKINHLVRLCGKTLDPFWVDNYCRRECASDKGKVTDFRDQLANGLISRTGYWQYYNLGSGVYLNQSKPEHYSREKWLKDIIYTLLESCNILEPDAKRLLEMYRSELNTLIGSKKVDAWIQSQFGDTIPQ